MPFTCRIHPDAHLAVLHFQDHVTAGHILDAIRAVAGDRDWQPGFNTLWDCRGIRELVFGPDDVTAFGELNVSIAERLGSGKGAIVTRRGLDHDIATLLVVRFRNSRRQRRIFFRMEEALDWLDLTEIPALRADSTRLPH